MRGYKSQLYYSSSGIMVSTPLSLLISHPMVLLAEKANNRFRDV